MLPNFFINLIKVPLLESHYILGLENTLYSQAVRKSFLPSVQKFSCLRVQQTSLQSNNVNTWSVSIFHMKTNQWFGLSYSQQMNLCCLTLEGNESQYLQSLAVFSMCQCYSCCLSINQVTNFYGMKKKQNAFSGGKTFGKDCVLPFLQVLQGQCWAITSFQGAVAGTCAFAPSRGCRLPLLLALSFPKGKRKNKCFEWHPV